MPTLIILTNASQGSAVTIRDMGIIIPLSGGSETFTDRRNIILASKSSYLRTFVTDDVHGASSSTLLLSEGTTAEVTDVTTVADSAGSLGGTHFTIDSPTQQFYVWFDVDNGSADPAVASRIGVEVDISANDTANTVASALQTAIENHADAGADFSASVSTNTVTVTNRATGSVTDAADTDTGFSISVTIQGVSTSISQANANAFLDALPAEYTASNAGVAGVGVFAQKIAGNFEFKNINVGSNQASVTDDTGNDEIDIDIIGANLTSVPTLAAVVSASSISGSADITTTSNTDILMITMSVVPGEAATYVAIISGAGFMDANNRSFFVSIATGTVAEITDVTTVADSAGSLGGTHFLITSPVRDYYVWFDVDNGSADPAVANTTGIEVDISANDTANTVAAALQVAMDAQTDFTASVLTNVVTITNAFSGFVPDAVNIDAGFTVNVTTQGTATQVAASERESEALDVLPWVTSSTTTITATQSIQGTWRIDTGTGTIRASRNIVAFKIAEV